MDNTLMNVLASLLDDLFAYELIIIRLPIYQTHHLFDIFRIIMDVIFIIARWLIHARYYVAIVI